MTTKTEEQQMQENAAQLESMGADPLAAPAPAISFKDAPIGTVHTGTVLTLPELVQGRDFTTGKPSTWPESGNPKMSVVFTILCHDGVERSVWATKPSGLFAALVAAQKEAGERIRVGGTVSISLEGEEKPKARGMNPAKIYAAVYTPNRS
jgi:hypothetical protein